MQLSILKLRSKPTPKIFHIHFSMYLFRFLSKQQRDSTPSAPSNRTSFASNLFTLCIGAGLLRSLQYVSYSLETIVGSSGRRKKWLRTKVFHTSNNISLYLVLNVFRIQPAARLLVVCTQNVASLLMSCSDLTLDHITFSSRIWPGVERIVQGLKFHSIELCVIFVSSFLDFVEAFLEFYNVIWVPKCL